MLPVLIALLLQASTISGELVAPKGKSVPGSAQVVLLPEEYAQMFNAEAQRRIDNLWEMYKPDFAQRKEVFSQAFALAYREALDTVTLRMRGDAKVSSLIRTASSGHFEFRAPPGDYKIVATGSIGETAYVWTESVHLKAGQVFIQMKQYVP